MSQLGLIIKREYLTDIRTRGFWISTFLFPLLMLVFGVVIGLLMEDSETLQKVGSISNAGADSKDLTGTQVAGMMTGTLLVIFLMVYGSQIFQKVKAEKTNRIIEVLATCVSGRTMMIGKIAAVGLTGITQIVAWSLLIFGGVAIALTLLKPDMLLVMADSRIIWAMIWSMLYFIGGYLLFGSFYACIGAMTDKDNENQGYIVMVTFLLMASFYISQFTIDNPYSPLAVWCSYIPFTSPGIGSVGVITGAMRWWEGVLSLLLLYGAACGGIILAGKIYTSAMLLNGKKFTLSDIMVILRAK